jgi:Tfp pilus assembly protein PilN
VSTTTTTSTRVVELPRVNLLPPEIFEKRQLQRTQAGLGVVVLAALVAVGLVYLNGGAAVTDAKSRLTSSQQTQIDLQKQINKVNYVTLEANQDDQAKAMLTQATASKISFSSYLADLGLLTPKNVWFTAVTLTNSVPVGTLATSTQAPPAVGSVTFTGQAVAHNDVATWLDNAAKEGGFANPYFTSSAETLVPGTGGATKLPAKTWITFNSSVALTSASLCGAETGKC